MTTNGAAAVRNPVMVVNKVPRVVSVVGSRFDM